LQLALRFTFGIPLIARGSARNWSVVEALLALAVTSVRAQTDKNFRVVIAGHDRPQLPLDTQDVIFIEADWPAEPVRPDNLDSGRKKHLINTSENHSENCGPFARWGQDFTNAVRREGKSIDDAFLARFGLRLASVCAVSELLSRDPTSPGFAPKDGPLEPTTPLEP
jgi:hypothetical protein